MKAIDPIRKQAKTEEIDYLFLINALSSYQSPRSKLTSLLKTGALIRVKKGIYVFGKDFRKRPYSLEVLANLIYGPSYVSFEYALSYWNLIPEATIRVTSACSKRIKRFETPVGEFVYAYIPLAVYPLGITLESVDEYTHFLIATKEKALADFLAKIKPFSSQKDLLTYLIEGMRIDKKDLMGFKKSLVKEIAKVYQNKNVSFLCEILQK